MARKNTPTAKPTEKDVARAARMYHSRPDAARALRIAPKTLSILCAKYGITERWRQK